MSRRQLAIVGVAVACIAVVGYSWGTSGVPARGADEGANESAGGARTTATVERRTLESREELDATLGYEGRYAIWNQRAGTITDLADDGQTIRRGDELYEVDGEPIVLMYGQRPAWRTLQEGMEGADVRQLESNVKALGYADDDMEVDGEFDYETTQAVERWQKDARQEVDGVVDLGEIVFLPGAVRIGTHKVGIGSPVQPGGEVLAATSTKKAVTLDLPADRRDLLEVGDKVRVELPNGKTTTGRVTSIGSVAEGGGQEGGQAAGQGSGEGEEQTVAVTIELLDSKATKGLDGGAAEVEVTRQSRKDVLAVPVHALLALLRGGYGVEVVDEDGRTRIVRVEVGLFADGYVEIRGSGVREGDRVVVAS